MRVIDKSLRDKPIRCQRGVFAPLLAIIGVAVLVVLITYGIDSSSVRQASKALEKYNEQTCRQVGERPVIQRDAIEAFRRQVQKAVDEGLIHNVKLVGANLIIPTMPVSGDFAFEGNPTSEPYVPDAVPIPIADFGFAACQIDCASGPCKDCKYLGNVLHATDFPPTLWNNLSSAGNVAACEMFGEIKTVLYGYKTLTVRTVWNAAVRGYFTPAPTAGTNDNPGLTLVVAPELQTRGGDARFRFSTNSTIFDTTFREKYDPLHHYDPDGSSPSLNAFYQTPQAGHTYPMVVPTPTPTSGATPTPTNTPSGGPPLPSATPTASWELQRPEIISGICRADIRGSSSNCQGPSNLPEQDRVPVGSDYGSYPDCMGFVGTPEPGTNCLVLSDREEMLAACMNPPVLIRNIITSTILELSMRHGQLRNMTELLVANPQHRNGGSRKNSPAQIIAHGQDLAMRNYQLPYVFYHGGNEKLGLINPFDSGHHQSASFTPVPTPGVTPKFQPLRNHHRLLSNQLRYCYHMFHEEHAQALSRFKVPGLENDGFEPNLEAAGTPEAYAFIPNLRERYPQPPDLWDQENPWNDAAQTYTNTRGLNGPEIAAALGSVQTCPYYQANLPYPNFPLPPPSPTPGGPVPAPNDGFCEKPTDPMDDLRGDLLGTLCYLKGDAPSSVCPNSFPGLPSNVFPVMKPPGLFAVMNPLSDDPVYDTVNPSDAYASAVNTRTPIVLVTHQALTHAERNDIEDLINEGHFDFRPITLIFVQAWEDSGNFGLGHNQNHLDHKIINDFKKAFDIPDQFDPSAAIKAGNRDNAIFVFSPYLASFDGLAQSDANCTSGTSLAPAACFSKYWAYLMDSSHDQNIHVAATNIFYNRILKVILKF